MRSVPTVVTLYDGSTYLAVLFSEGRAVPVVCGTLAWASPLRDDREEADEPVDPPGLCALLSGVAGTTGEGHAGEHSFLVFCWWWRY